MDSQRKKDKKEKQTEKQKENNTNVSLQAKKIIINCYTYKLKNYFNMIDKFTNDLRKIDEVSSFDTQQITILKQIAVHLFLLLEDITITNEAIVPQKSQNIRRETEETSKEILNNFLPDDIGMNQRRQIFERAVPIILKHKTQETKFRYNLEEVLKKLYHVKQEVIDSSMKIGENFYFFIQKKTKESLEIVFLYLNDKHNVDSYRTNFFFGHEKRQIENQARNSIKNIVTSRENNISPDKINDIVKYVMTALQGEKIRRERNTS